MYKANESDTLYPCITIDGICHVMTDGSTCACGKKYDYVSEPVPEETVMINSPLRWHPLSTVTCKICYSKYDVNQIFLSRARNI